MCHPRRSRSHDISRHERLDIANGIFIYNFVDKDPQRTSSGRITRRDLDRRSRRVLTNLSCTFVVDVSTHPRAPGAGFAKIGREDSIPNERRVRHGEHRLVRKNIPTIGTSKGYKLSVIEQ